MSPRGNTKKDKGDTGNKQLPNRQGVVLIVEGDTEEVFYRGLLKGSRINLVVDWK